MTKPNLISKILDDSFVSIVEIPLDKFNTDNLEFISERLKVLLIPFVGEKASIEVKLNDHGEEDYRVKIKIQPNFN